MFIKEGTNFTQLYKDQINNTIFLSLEDDNLFVIGTYLRPDDKLDNEIQVAEIYNKINDIKENHPNSKIIMVGDLNRSEPIEKRYIQKLLNEHDYKDFSHFNNKLEKNSQSKLSKIYYYNTKIKSHVCKELMNTLSDHAGILIQLPDEGLKFAPSWINCPNQKVSKKIKWAIRSSLPWKKIHGKFYWIKKFLISWNTTKKNPKIWNDIIKQLINDLANGLDSIKIEGKFNETSDNFLSKITNFIFSKDKSGEGWKNLKNLTKYNLIGKKEGKIVNKIIDYNDKIRIGSEKDKVIIKHFKDQHKETNKNWWTKVQKFNFNIKVSTDQVIEMCKKLSQGKALSWDCISDTSFKLCNKCLESKQCEKCSNKIQKIKDLFKVKFWKSKYSKKHLLCWLVPLDKAHPKIPLYFEYWPIVVTSPIIKLLEQHLLSKLQPFCEKFLNKNQIGFMWGWSTMDNVIRLINDQRKMSNKGALLF